MNSFQVRTNAAARKQCKNKKDSGMEAYILLPILISQISFLQYPLRHRTQEENNLEEKKILTKKSEKESGATRFIEEIRDS